MLEIEILCEREKRQRERKRERKREKEIGDFDSRNSPQQYFSPKNISVVQVDIRFQGINSTLVPDSS